MESCGVDTSAWFAQQIELCLLGIAVCFGWEKALGGADELAWWTARADAAVAHLDG